MKSIAVGVALNFDFKKWSASRNRMLFVDPDGLLGHLNLFFSGLLVVLEILGSG